jgi:hypothetical protein
MALDTFPALFVLYNKAQIDSAFAIEARSLATKTKADKLAINLQQI